MYLGSRLGKLNNRGVYQGIGVNDYVGSFNQTLGLERKEFRVPGAATDEVNHGFRHYVTF